jgi:DNA-binding transcriptional regulator YdaS (Cro superfamily)
MSLNSDFTGENMELRYWLIENKKLATKFADEIGVHRNTIYRILNGQAPCSIAVAMLIEKHTRGRVSRFEVPMSQRSIDILLGNVPRGESETQEN